MGRPPGKEFPHYKGIRMKDEDVRRLEALSQKLEQPEAEVVREALRELARREGVE